MVVLKYLVKLAVTGGFIWLFVRKVDMQEAWRAVTEVNLFLFFLAFGVAILSWLFNSLRWQKLLELASVRLPVWRLFLYNLIGFFYAIILPGGKLAGDTVSAIRFTNDLAEPENRKKYFLSVFIDRFLGILNILLFLSPFFLWQLPVIGVFGERTWLVGGLVLGGNVLILLIMFSSVLDFGLSWLAKIPMRWIASLANNLLGALKVYRQDYWRLVKVLFYSITGVTLTALYVYLLAKGLALPLSFGEVGFSYLMATILIAIPITIGGIGLREGAFVYFLTSLGIELHRAAALSILTFLMVVMMSLVGAMAEVWHHWLSRTKKLKS